MAAPRSAAVPHDRRVSSMTVSLKCPTGVEPERRFSARKRRPAAGLALALAGLAACATVEPKAQPAAELPAGSAPWLRAETAHFVVYSELDEKATRRDAAELEAFHDFVGWAMPGVEEPPGTLEVYLMDRREELQRVVPGK